MYIYHFNLLIQMEGNLNPVKLPLQLDLWKDKLEKW